jgi:hypothetical protein
MAGLGRLKGVPPPIEFPVVLMAALLLVAVLMAPVRTRVVEFPVLDGNREGLTVDVDAELMNVVPLLAAALAGQPPPPPSAGGVQRKVVASPSKNSPIKVLLPAATPRQALIMDLVVSSSAEAQADEHEQRGPEAKWGESHATMDSL